MIAKKYDAEVSKVLPIHVDVPDGITLTNYYPHYIMAKSTEISDFPWNQKGFSMNYNVVWESKDMESGYPAYVGVRFRIYREGEYVGSCYVKYDCRNGEIEKFSSRIVNAVENVAEEDVMEFIQQVILIFGRLAYKEYAKIENIFMIKDITEITSNENEIITPVPQPTTNTYSSENELPKVRHYKNYVKISWQKHGFYNKKGLYIKSCICYRNKNLLK